MCGKTLSFEQLYGGDFCYNSLLKRGKKSDTFKTSCCSRANRVKETKKADVIVTFNLCVNLENCLWMRNAFQCKPGGKHSALEMRPE